MDFLNIKTNGSHARVRELESINFFNCNFLENGPIVIKFCTHTPTDKMNNTCTYGYCMISTSGFITHFMLCPVLLHVYK